MAADESYWLEVQQAYTVNRTMVNLNNGGVSPAPQIVQQAMKRYLDVSNESTAYTMWRWLEPQRESVRQQLGRLFQCDPEELAVVRNASEGLQIAQCGFDLKAGDEILTTTQDYPRMITTYQQRERRDGVKLVQIQIPVPAEDDNEVVRRFEQGITSRTKIIHISHMINLTGQILPVKKVVQMARRRGIPVIVDGAHSFAHFPFKQADLDCDFFATSLHKWLCAPHGTGMMYVKKDKIKDLWPLQAAPASMDENIRKYEEIGTHPAANILAISEAIMFHNGIGAERKAARLVYLREHWMKQLESSDRVKFHTSRKPGLACGLANVQILGVDSAQLSDYLLNKYNILTVAIKHPEFEGIRVTPQVYTTIEELDRFADAMNLVLKNGLPKT
ncbi:MAG: aminotransferase class V-fold PLP-dependent enzyme [Rhodothermia bacterium]|nr:aminotransferase class V-fold PLP-dependent enzyme [Rhodothermia bacterium]